MTKKITFIGDIHGKYMAYLRLLEELETDTVQVGDFGFGFGLLGRHEFIDGLINASEAEFRTKHYMIRGNHDNPDEAKLSEHFIQDGDMWNGMFFMGGAASIDRAMRTEGKDWWSNEESTTAELDELIDLYSKAQPRVLVTHECHESFAANVMIPKVNGIANFRSRTRDALEVMHSIHKPEVHIFGHWHVKVDEFDGPTRMVCIPELGHFELEVD